MAGQAFSGPQGPLSTDGPRRHHFENVMDFIFYLSSWTLTVFLFINADSRSLKL